MNLRIIPSRQTFSGGFYILGMYLAYSNWLLPSIISMIMGTVILKHKAKP